MKARLPRFLTPRRKYEVDGSMWLVKFGRPKVKFLMLKYRAFGAPALKQGWMATLTVARGARTGILVTTRAGRVAASIVGAGGRNVVLFVQWRRMPKPWELTFVNKMKAMEVQGIPFPDVLKTYLPVVMGEAPSGVLLNWVGRQTRHQPKRFVNVAAKMFGRSSKSIITGLERVADPIAMLEGRKPVEPPYQSLVDAIRKADSE